MPIAIMINITGIQGILIVRILSEPSSQSKPKARRIVANVGNFFFF